MTLSQSVNLLAAQDECSVIWSAVGHRLSTVETCFWLLWSIFQFKVISSHASTKQNVAFYVAFVASKHGVGFFAEQAELFWASIEDSASLGCYRPLPVTEGRSEQTHRRCPALQFRLGSRFSNQNQLQPHQLQQLFAQTGKSHLHSLHFVQCLAPSRRYPCHLSTKSHRILWEYWLCLVLYGLNGSRRMRDAGVNLRVKPLSGKERQRFPSLTTEDMEKKHPAIAGKEKGKSRNRGPFLTTVNSITFLKYIFYSAPNLSSFC